MPSLAFAAVYAVAANYAYCMPRYMPLPQSSCCPCGILYSSTLASGSIVVQNATAAVCAHGAVHAATLVFAAASV